MVRALTLAVALLALAAPAQTKDAVPKVSAEIAAAVADSGRPPADVERDADRKPAETLAFAGVAKGQVVGELLPGGGYFTRLISKTVGPEGVVYAVAPPPSDPAKTPPVLAIAADPAYANVKVLSLKLGEIALPAKADIIWTSENYHDLHLKRLALDVAAVNRAVFEALKPGGEYFIVDHVAATGSPVEVADTLHRIDPAIVRREVEAAGFVFAGESDILHKPADDHSKPVFDPSIRGHTDQFVLRFRKPG